MGLFGPPDIDKLETNRDVKGLIKALSYKKSGMICHNAARALGRLGDKQAVPALINALQDDSSVVANAAARALGELGDARAVDPLIVALRNPDLCQDPVTALGQLRDPRAIDAIVAVLLDKHSWGRMHAATALGNFNDLRAVNALIQVLGDDDATLYIFAEQSLEKQGPLSIDPLIAALKNGSGRIRQVAIRLLWEAKATKAIDPLVELLTRDPDHAQRKEAATALKFLGWKPGEDAAGAAYWVCEGDWEHCIQMGSLAVEPLVAILNSNDEKVNIQVVRALGDIADPRAVEPLIMAMRSYPTELEASLALVKIYRSGNIGEAQKNIILQHKEEITKQRHRDFHDDGDCPKGHTDYGKDIFSL